MRIPVIQGTIDRRILVNYRVDPEILRRSLPAPFRPKLVNGFGIAGICLIRLKEIRPRFTPSLFGHGSENAAHRIAVEWDDAGKTREGVYVPRRDTSSKLNSILGGRLFPGIQHLAQFGVTEEADSYGINLDSVDGQTHLSVKADLAKSLPATSTFGTLSAASAFFEGGSSGYSATQQPDRFDGMELRCLNWQVEPMTVTKVESSFFDDRTRFPLGSVEFDCALLMRNIAHEWRELPTCVAAGPVK